MNMKFSAGKCGKLLLVYDLTYSNSFGGECAMVVNGGNLGLPDILAVTAGMGIEEERVRGDHIDTRGSGLESAVERLDGSWKIRW